MKKNIKSKNNKGPAPYEAKGFRSGFAILFAVTLASILLSIALGVANVALKEVRFSTSSKSTNEAFFAADTGVECALSNDKSTSISFSETGGSGVVTCLGGQVALSGAYPLWNFILPNLGTSGQNCAKVTVSKIYNSATTPPSTITTVTSKGYNIGDINCDSTNPGRIAREVKSIYGVDSSGILGNTAAFVRSDNSTQGNWHGVYGADGYNIFGGTQAYPSYATVTPAGNSVYTWADPTPDTRGLFKDGTTTSRIAATWYAATNYTLDVNLTDGYTHQVAIYMVDWDSYGPRQATVEVLDASTSAVLSTQTLANYVTGSYLVWNVSGHVIFRFTNTGSSGGNVVTSGIFFR